MRVRARKTISFYVLFHNSHSWSPLNPVYPFLFFFCLLYFIQIYFLFLYIHILSAKFCVRRKTCFLSFWNYMNLLIIILSKFIHFLTILDHNFPYIWITFRFIYKFIPTLCYHEEEQQERGFRYPYGRVGSIHRWFTDPPPPTHTLTTEFVF